MAALRSRVGLAAGFMLAARGRIVRLVDQDVIVACSADHAVDRFGELVVTGSHFFGVFGTRLRSADSHGEIIPAHNAGAPSKLLISKAAHGETLLR